MLMIWQIFRVFTLELSRKVSSWQRQSLFRFEYNFFLSIIVKLSAHCTMMSVLCSGVGGVESEAGNDA